jgi:hypothetical protein
LWLNVGLVAQPPQRVEGGTGYVGHGTVIGLWSSLSCHSEPQPYKSPRTKLASARSLAELARRERYGKGVEWIELVTMTIASPSLLG